MPKTLASTKDKLVKEKTSPKANPPKKSTGRTKTRKQPKKLIDRCGSCKATKKELDEEDETLWEDGTFCKNYGTCDNKICKECVEEAWSHYSWHPADEAEEAIYTFEANDLRCMTCTPDQPVYEPSAKSSDSSGDSKDDSDDKNEDKEPEEPKKKVETKTNEQ